MKYTYAVKSNGKWYQPGEDVPEITPTTETAGERANQHGIAQVEEVQSAEVPLTVEDEPKRRGRKPKYD